MIYQTSKYNKDPSVSMFSSGHFTHGTNYSDMRGEFCVIRGSGYVHGYTTKGCVMDRFTHQRRPPQSDFQTFIREISDSGTSTFNRPFTTEEKSFLVLKFGYPIIPSEDVALYYDKVKRHFNYEPPIL